MDKNSTESMSIEWLRYAMAASVIFMHAGISFNDSFTEFYRYGNFSLLVMLYIIVVMVLSQFAVPTFFLLSGYFFFSGYSKKQTNKIYYKTKIKSRIMSLLIPYIIWNTLYVILKVIIDKCIFHITFDIHKLYEFVGFFWDSNNYDFTTNILGINMPIGRVPIDGPLWFVRDLIVCSIISPVFPFMIKRLKKISLVIPALLMIFNIWLPFTFVTSVGFFFFLLGAYFQINKINLFSLGEYPNLKRRIILALFTILFITVLYMYSVNENYYFYVLKVTTIFCPFILLYIINFLFKKNYIHYNKRMSNSSFFIYAAHWIYALGASLFISRLIVQTVCSTSSMLFQQFSQWFIGSIITIIVLTIIHIVICKYMPSLCKYLDGGRN